MIREWPGPTDSFCIPAAVYSFRIFGDTFLLIYHTLHTILLDSLRLHDTTEVHEFGEYIIRSLDYLIVLKVLTFWLVFLHTVSSSRSSSRNTSKVEDKNFLFIMRKQNDILDFTVKLFQERRANHKLYLVVRSSNRLKKPYTFVSLYYYKHAINMLWKEIHIIFSENLATFI